MAADPDFLAIGHVTLDLTQDGQVPGGTAFYAAVTAARLGRKVGLLTRGAPPQSKEPLAALEQVVNIPSPVTTIFENRYDNGVRTQRLHSAAPAIEVKHLPDGWQDVPMVLLAPVFQEVESSLARCFPKALLGVAPQGWFRRATDTGRIEHMEWNNEEVLSRAEVVILSEMELFERRVPANWLTHGGIIVLTQGARGALMHYDNRWFRIPAHPTEEVDPTGAGDVFAAAYLIRYGETGDAIASGLFASCAASLKVAAKGAAGIPTRKQITRRMEQFPNLKVVPCRPDISSL